MILTEELIVSRTIAFVVGFSTFLIACIDWARIRGSHSLSEIIIPHGLSKYYLLTPAHQEILIPCKDLFHRNISLMVLCPILDYQTPSVPSRHPKTTRTPELLPLPPRNT
jgi:hypothetical protein